MKILILLCVCILVRSDQITGNWNNVRSFMRIQGEKFFSGIQKSISFSIKPFKKTTPVNLHRIWSNSKNKRNIVSNILLFVLSTTLDSCISNASPLNQQPLKLHGPFFQGWLVRNIDHTQNISFIFVVGSFSSRNCATYDEHYIFCGLNTNEYTKQVESFPEPTSVIIKGSQPGSYFSPLQNLNISWVAKGHGQFLFTNQGCVAQFNIGSNFRLKFRTTSRIPWKDLKEDSNNNEGPEGWLGCTPFLPCHYFVHSVGSQCEYEIYNNENTKDFHLKGSGYAHIEGNHGSFFPEGWTWCQTISVNNEASLSFVGGKFEIAGLKPMNFVVYFRRRNGCRVIFRTTDLDVIKYRIQPTRGFVSISASSLNLLRKERLEITVAAASLNSPSAKTHFGRPVFIPTANGFSNSPGCLETYDAVATVQYFPNGDASESPESYRIPLTALEFGGSFVGKYSLSS